MKTAYLTHRDCIKHDMGLEHPESPARLGAIRDALVEARIMDSLMCVEAPKVSRDHILRVHDETYVNNLFDQRPDESSYLQVDADTGMNHYSLDAALYASGAVVKATDLVLTGEADNAFCNVRPPGHHAERNKAMGFCFFNSIAVGAMYAIEKYGLERVAIFDFDVHHGNGTEDIFENEPRVLICSSYQSPLYPYSGCESIEGHIINVALPSATEGATYRKNVEREWLPQLHAFKPEMIFISAGFDAHRDDPLAQLCLDEADFAWLTQMIMDIASQYSENRIVSSLEGGYNLNALGRSALAHVKTLLACT